MMCCKLVDVDIVLHLFLSDNLRLDSIGRFCSSVYIVRFVLHSQPLPADCPV